MKMRYILISIFMGILVGLSPSFCHARAYVLKNYQIPKEQMIGLCAPHNKKSFKAHKKQHLEKKLRKFHYEFSQICPDRYVVNSKTLQFKRIPNRPIKRAKDFKKRMKSIECMLGEIKQFKKQVQKALDNLQLRLDFLKKHE